MKMSNIFKQYFLFIKNDQYMVIEILPKLRVSIQILSFYTTRQPKLRCNIIMYTVILKDSYTLTPNLNMKKWF